MASSMVKEVQSGPGKNKRKWTAEEDQLLVEAIVDLFHAGTHKADGGFKSGYLLLLERVLESKLPGCALKGEPHIKSRIKTLKKDYYIVHEMLYGPNVSGFGWDDSKKCVVAEKPVWDAYVASHKGAGAFMNKSFPHYDALNLVYGKDRATGKDAQAPADVVEEMDKDEMNIGGEDLNDTGASMSVTQQVDSGQSSGQKRKRRSGSSSDLGSSIIEAAKILGSNIKEAADRFSKAIGDNVAEMRKIINDELMKLPDLSMVERHRAVRIIGRDSDTTEIFFTIPEEEKLAFVVGLLHGEI